MTDMKIKFWGVRGSFPVSSSEHEQYGGNTPCVEVEAGGTRVIIDAGTGIRAAGKKLLESGLSEIQILLSHTHWDHIQGFPHFEPLYNTGFRVEVHSFKRRDSSLKEIFRKQQRSPFFPVSLDNARADVEFIEHEDGDNFSLGAIEVRCRRLNHPGPAGGFRLNCSGRTFAYVCDVDLYGDSLMADGFSADNDEQKQSALESLREAARDLGHNADAVLCDTFFLPDEYEPWGHSSPDDAIRLAEEAKARAVILFHHRPGREDGHLDELVDKYRQQAGNGIELWASREGLEIAL